MAHIANEYRVQIHPDGTWFVCYLQGEELHDVANGKESTVEAAEQAARGLIYVEQAKKRAQEEYQGRVKKFTVPA
jgi:hypothetical protein